MEQSGKSEKVYEALRKIYFENTVRKEEFEDEISRALSEFCHTEDEEMSFSMDMIIEEWSRLWEREVGMEMNPEEKRRDLIENYVRVYISKVEESDLTQMLVHDFFQGMRQVCNDGKSNDWMDMWFLTLKQNYESVKSPGQVVENALNRMDLKKK